MHRWCLAKAPMSSPAALHHARPAQRRCGQPAARGASKACSTACCTPACPPAARSRTCTSGRAGCGSRAAAHAAAAASARPQSPAAACALLRRGAVRMRGGGRQPGRPCRLVVPSSVPAAAAAASRDAIIHACAWLRKPILPMPHRCALSGPCGRALPSCLAPSQCRGPPA